jgi:hypothetical protein
MHKLATGGHGLDLLATAACSFREETPEKMASDDEPYTKSTIEPYTKSTIETKGPAKKKDFRWLSVTTPMMLGILVDYGPEIPARNWDGNRFKHPSQVSSIRRMFKNCNPTFFESFVEKNYTWSPRLGKEQEIQRRVHTRKAFKEKKKFLKKRKPDSTHVASDT